MIDWQEIETAPEGVPRIQGASKVHFMFLAWPDDEGGFNMGHGVRINAKFYSTGVFHCGGPFDGKQFRFKEIEVSPTYWAEINTPLEKPKV